MGYNLSHLRFKYTPPPRRGGTPLYKPYSYVPPQRVGCISVLTGLDFAYLDLESGMVFKGTTGYEYIYHCSSK